MQKGENMFCFYVNSVFFTDHMSETFDFNYILQHCHNAFSTVSSTVHIYNQRYYNILFICLM